MSIKSPASSLSSLQQVWVGELQVAKITGMSLAWLRKKRITGGGISFSKMGRSIKYNLSDVQDYLDQRKVNSTSEYQSNHNVGASK